MFDDFLWIVLGLIVFFTVILCNPIVLVVMAALLALFLVYLLVVLLFKFICFLFKKLV